MSGLIYAFEHIAGLCSRIRYVLSSNGGPVHGHISRDTYVDANAIIKFT